MELRTTNIIMICKGRHNYGDISPKQALKKYMSNTCGTEETDYNDKILLDIVHNAVCDYISTCENPQSFLFDYFEALTRSGVVEAWLVAFQLINVRKIIENGKWICINGFTEETLEVIDENTNKPMFDLEQEKK